MHLGKLRLILILGLFSVVGVCVTHSSVLDKPDVSSDYQIEERISKRNEKSSLASGDRVRSKLESMKKEVVKAEGESTDSILKGVLPPLAKDVDERALVNQVLSIMQMSKNNADVITQAFRFVRLDAHLSTLLSQLSLLRESQESIQAENIRRQTKFNVVLDEIRTLAANVAKESLRLSEVEERLESEIEMMNDRIDSALEKIIQSAVSTQLLLDLSKETIQQTDKAVGISNEVLIELKSTRTELADVGQASVQTIYNVQKLEESLLMAMEESLRNHSYALRQDHQQHQLQYQVLPLASPMKMDVDEVSLVPLENGRVGNFIQADGTITPTPEPTTALPAVANSNNSTSSFPSFPFQTGTSVTTNYNDENVDEENRKLKTIGMRGMSKNIASTGTTASYVKSSGTVKSTEHGREESLVSPCPSFQDKKIFSEQPRNCKEIQMTGHASSGVYEIFPFNQTQNGTEIYCDMITDGGGWTVIQRRKEPLLMQENFQRSWDEYAAGFGILHDSHFIGLDLISKLSEAGVELRIDMMDWDGVTRFAKYAYFRVANATEQFKMYVTDYSGNAGDSLAYHNDMPFTTKDRDNDLEKNVNCAQKYHGAWWYKSCHQSNLNGMYISDKNGKHSTYADGLNWYTWHGYYYSLKRAEMKIRVKHFE